MERTTTLLKSIILAMGLIAMGTALHAQIYTIPESGSDTITTCSGNLYDHGGETENYSPDAEGAITILPEEVGRIIKLTLNSYECYSADLKIFFGADTSSAPSLVYDNVNDFSNPVIYGSHETGAITLKFTGTASYGGPGFDFTIECLDEYPDYDLEILSAGVQTDTVPGGINFGTFSNLDNNGEVPSNFYNINYYLSEDTVLDPNDELFFDNQQESITPDVATYVGESFIQVSPDLAPGWYYFFMVLDPDSILPEINEDNNIAMDSMYVRQAIESAEITSFSITPNETNSGNQVNYSFDLDTDGEADQLSSVEWVLKAGTTGDPEDASIELASGISNDVGAGGFPQPEGEGSFIPEEEGIDENQVYHLFLQLDPNEKLHGDPQDNNIAMQPLDINNSLPLEIQLPVEGNDSASACNAILYDDGGADDIYTTPSTGIITVYPEHPDQVLAVEFTMIDINDRSSVINIYDGISNSSDLLGSFSGELSTDNTIRYEATTPGSPLTVELDSDLGYNFSYDGLEAEFSCTNITSVKNRSATNLLIVPNPVSSYININNLQSEDFDGQVISLRGQTVKTFSNITRLNVSDLKAGTYILSVTSKDGKSITRRFIKN